MSKQKIGRGQALVEMTVILPVLLIFLVGVAEMGVALRNYLVVVNASREACRFAARGGYLDRYVGERVGIAGGAIRAGDFVTDTGSVPFLRTHDYDTYTANTGIIVTHIVISSTGTVLSTTQWYSGVVLYEGGEISNSISIAAGNSLLDMDQTIARQTSSTKAISTIRSQETTDERGNHVVVVEVFFMHPLLLDLPLLPMPNPWQMYARTEMRIWGE